MFRNIAIALTGNATSLNSTLHAAAAQVDAYGNRVEATNRRSVASWKQAAAAALLATAAIKVGLAAAVVPAAQFEQRMRNVNSITHASEEAFRGLSESTLSLSTRLPQSANVLAEGLYDIASSGFQGAEGLQVLEASAQAASAGMTDTANAGKAITAVLNAYGLSAASAGNVSDSLFQTVNLGVVSFEELAGVIGDVVGTAAAASVDINQVGAAVATMTLTGISAAESGTSLNRVLQSLLQPGEALAAVYQSLGYESGAAALQTRGLGGVMEDLRKATGGNVTTLLQLFPEIRAARGALALMSDEGRTYAGVAGQIEDADARQGATKKALAEQLKAVAAQWQIFVNRAQAAGIAGGTLLLPMVLDVMHGVSNLAEHGLPVLMDGLHQLAPLFSNVRDIGVDVFELLETLAHIAAPVAAGLLAIAGAPILAGLTALSDGVAALTGFLEDNQAAVIALASLMGGLWLVSMLRAVAATVAFNVAAFRAVGGMAAFTGGTAGMAAGARFAAAGVAGLAASLISLQAVATLGAAAVFAAAGLAINSWQKAGQAADAYVSKTTAGFNALDPAKAQKTIDALRETAESSVEYGKQFEGAGGTFRAGWNAIFGDADDIARKGNAAADTMKLLQAQVNNAAENLDFLKIETGLSTEALTKLAIANDIDLSKPFNDSGDARVRVINLTKDLEKQTGISAENMRDSMGLDIDQMLAFGKAAEETAKKVAGSFASATDVISGFKVDTGKGAASASSQFRTFVTQNAADADRFADNLQKATARGLDPQFIARLLEAGPAQAAPVLEQLVGSSGSRMIELVNKTERQLQAIGQRVAEFSRLTQAAVNSSTDEMTSNLSTAMQIASAQLAAGGKATAAQIAKAIGKPTAEVIAVAKLFGITIAKAVQAGIDSARPSVTVTGIGAGKVSQLTRREKGMYAGGQIAGPYLGPTADNVLIRANPREYVHQVAAVDYYGTGVMDAINRRLIPKGLFSGLRGYANGGQVGRGGGSVTVLRIPMTEQRTHQAPVYVDKQYVADYDDFRRQEQQERSLQSMPGYRGPRDW